MTTTKHITSFQDIHTLYDLSIFNCLQFGTYKMLIYEDAQSTRELTNVEVTREATQLGVGLQSLGIEKGDRVIVMMLNSPEVVISYQAIARAGAVIIPVLPLLKGPEVRYIAENSAAKAIITDAILLPLLQSALADVPTLQHIIATGSVGIQSTAGDGRDESRPYIFQVHPYRDIVARGVSHADAYLSDLDGVTLSPDDTAVTLYTSGTTGRPKGVLLTHRNVVANAIGGRGTDTELTRSGERGAGGEGRAQGIAPTMDEETSPSTSSSIVGAMPCAQYRSNKKNDKIEKVIVRIERRNWWGIVRLALVLAVELFEDARVAAQAPGRQEVGAQALQEVLA
jgi:long-chain acyl-CoA synthetase